MEVTKSGVFLMNAVLSAKESASEVSINDAYEKRRVEVTEPWLAEKNMPAAEIEKNAFLKAAVKFADTTVQHGRDTYGKEHTPLFADVLNVDTLKSPRARTSYRSGTEPVPTVWCFFNNQQNLLRLLVSLSSITGERKYIDAAYDATAFMFERYQEKESGLFYWGGHRYIDLVSGNTYGAKGEVHELEDVFPFWELILAVDADNGEKLIKGMWEAHISDWKALHYNRHAEYGRKPDFSKTWERPWQGGGKPRISGDLSFQSTMLDCSFAAFNLGFIKKDEKPIAWAERFVNVFVEQRDAKTKIWPHLAHPQSGRRGLRLYGEKYPNATEQRLYVGNIIEYVPRYMMGGLAMVESAQKYGYTSRLQQVQQVVEEYILGYMTAAYDSTTHTMRHIINDGTDVTGYVFKTSGYFGAKEGGAFVPYRVSPLYHSVIARAYRLSGGKAAYWRILRELFRGAKLGELGTDGKAEAEFNYETETAEPGYVFALADMYRATKNREYLRFAEHIGRNIVKYRQHPDNGLFTLEDSRVVYPGIYEKGSRLSEVHEGKTVFELFGRKHRTAALDVQEPLALLSIYAAETGQFDKIPMWFCGGLYGGGRAFSSGYVVSHEFELWFDKPALE